VDEVYEEPEHAEITIDTDSTNVDEAVEIIVKHVKKNCIK
jgi:adenylylsulfate kinase